MRSTSTNIYTLNFDHTDTPQIEVLHADQEKRVIQFHLEELRRTTRRHGRVAVRKDYVLVLLFVKVVSDKYVD